MQNVRKSLLQHKNKHNAMGKEQTKRKSAKTTQQKPRAEKVMKTRVLILFKKMQNKRKQRRKKGKHHIHMHMNEEHTRTTNPEHPKGRQETKQLTRCHCAHDNITLPTQQK